MPVLSPSLEALRLFWRIQYRCYNFSGSIRNKMKRRQSLPMFAYNGLAVWDTDLYDLATGEVTRITATSDGIYMVGPLQLMFCNGGWLSVHNVKTDNRLVQEHMPSRSVDIRYPFLHDDCYYYFFLTINIPGSILIKRYSFCRLILLIKQ